MKRASDAETSPRASKQGAAARSPRSTLAEHRPAGGVLYASPAEAHSRVPRESLAYVTCTPTGEGASERGCYLATVDVSPESPTYGRVVHRLHFDNKGDEVHRSCWNYYKHEKLIVPGSLSGRIYVVDVAGAPRAPTLFKTVEPAEIEARAGATFPHTAHCLPSGEVLVSAMGDEKGHTKGSFYLLDENFDVKGPWSEESTQYGYDFWYQPAQNVMISTGFGDPQMWANGFNAAEYESVTENVEANYASSIHIWDWKERKIRQTLHLGSEGLLPLEIRFLHAPAQGHAYVGCALSGNVFHIYSRNEGGKDEWHADAVIKEYHVPVAGWMFSKLPPFLSDIVISLDDQWMYVSNWLHGSVKQYNLHNPANPRLCGEVFLGGLLLEGGPVTRLDGGHYAKPPVVTSGAKIEGGPQMLQLSADGKRLYVTNSLYSVWDKEFYPELARRGSAMLQVDVDTGAKGGLALNPSFCLDFTQEEAGPTLAHEMRFDVGVDSSGDIWT